MIALYQGISPISRLIRWLTWSVYSHVAWMHEDFSVTEAWAGSVRHAAHFAAQHSHGTQIDLFEVDLTSGEQDGLEAFLAAQVGKPYDYAGVLGFVSRRDRAQKQNRWFCSELIFAAFLHIHRPLLCRIEPHRVSPGDLALSPLLVENGSVLCGKPYRRNHGEKLHPEIVDGQGLVPLDHLACARIGYGLRHKEQR